RQGRPGPAGPGGGHRARRRRDRAVAGRPLDRAVARGACRQGAPQVGAGRRRGDQAVPPRPGVRRGTPGRAPYPAGPRGAGGPHARPARAGDRAAVRRGAALRGGGAPGRRARGRRVPAGAGGADRRGCPCRPAGLDGAAHLHRRPGRARRAERPQQVAVRPEPTLRATAAGATALIALFALEYIAVGAAMPTVATALDGFDLYNMAFGATVAASVVGMVVGGWWSDRAGPRP